MQRLIVSMKEQGVLFAEHYLDDRLPKTHEVYAFDAVLQQMDMSELMESYSAEGGKLYSPKDMLAVLLYAYSKGITSSYRIANEVRTNIAFIYLAGGHIISRRAICEFRKRNVEHLRALFSSTVQKAEQVGLLREDKIFGIDGTKIATSASMSKTRTKEEAQERQEKIKKSVDRFFEELEENDNREEGIEEEDEKRHEERMRKIRELKENKEKKITKEARKIERLLRESAAIEKTLKDHPDLKDDERINTTDPDSRLMQNGTGEYLQGYNAQIVTSNQIICAVDLVQDENDQNCLRPMIEQLEKELPQLDEYGLLGDAGYNKGENLKWLAEEKENINAFVSMRDRKEDAKTDLEKATGRGAFEYDEKNDQYICPAGALLNLASKRNKKGVEHSIYRANLMDCQRCAAREICLSTKEEQRAGVKIIDDNGTLAYRNAMKAKMALSESKEIYGIRAIEPEPIWGNWKHNLGFLCFRTKTFLRNKGETVLMATVNNLMKLTRRQIKLQAATV